MTAAAGGDPGARVLIAVPTYDERDNIGALLAAALRCQPGADVLVVDDASPDGTAALVAAAALRDPRIHLLARDRKRGVGSAHRAAFAWAAGRDYDLVVSMDADGSHDAAHIARLLEAAEAADVVVGSRYVSGGRIAEWPAHRRALSAGGNAVARALAGSAVRDWTSGFRCYRAGALRSLDWTRVRSDGYGFNLEILVHGVRLGWTVREVPIAFVDRRRGRTKMPPAEVGRALATLLRLAWHRDGAG